MNRFVSAMNACSMIKRTYRRHTICLRSFHQRPFDSDRFVSPPSRRVFLRTTGRQIRSQLVFVDLQHRPRVESSSRMTTNTPAVLQCICNRSDQSVDMERSCGTLLTNCSHLSISPLMEARCVVKCVQLLPKHRGTGDIRDGVSRSSGCYKLYDVNGGPGSDRMILRPRTTERSLIQSC